MSLHETPGVAVDATDRVYALTRNPANPIIVFRPDGTVINTFGQGVLGERTHGLSVTAAGTVVATDDGRGIITIWSQDGYLLRTIGTPDAQAPKWSGVPFSRPTHAVVSPRTGDIFVSDGYANARVHRFSHDGHHISSWGSPGVDPGQFMVPHNIAVDADDRVLVADREAHRIQVFDTDGRLQDVWHDIHRPSGLTIGPEGNIYIAELNGLSGVDDCPGYGHRVSIYSPDGALITRFGDVHEGESPGQFIAPHGIAVDSRGDIYVGEVSYSIRGHLAQPPRELRSLSKLVRQDSRVAVSRIASTT
jgi:streptogramin lyase